MISVLVWLAFLVIIGIPWITDSRVVRTVSVIFVVALAGVAMTLIFGA